MSVYIKGMEMPKNCDCCDIAVRVQATRFSQDTIPFRCPLVDEYIEKSGFEVRLGDCPLIEIQPHGRLVDADAFAEKNKVFMDCDFTHPCYGDTLEELFADAPTIIEAEGVTE